MERRGFLQKKDKPGTQPQTLGGGKRPKPSHTATLSSVDENTQGDHQVESRFENRRVERRSEVTKGKPPFNSDSEITVYQNAVTFTDEAGLVDGRRKRDSDTSEELINTSDESNNSLESKNRRLNEKDSFSDHEAHTSRRHDD